MKIAIIGSGYVGLPLAAAFASKYNVIGFDINTKRVEELNNGFDATNELSSEKIKKVLEEGSSANGLSLTDNIDFIKDSQIYIVTVPTPITIAKTLLIIRSIKKCIKNDGKFLSKDDIVIYESTVYPGCTEEVCVPDLGRKSGLVFNKDFFCGYSPERINPGDKINTLQKLKK